MKWEIIRNPGEIPAIHIRSRDVPADLTCSKSKHRKDGGFSLRCQIYSIDHRSVRPCSRSFPESCGMLGIKPGSPGNGKSWGNQEFKDFFHQDPTTYPRLRMHSPSKRFQGVDFAISSPTRARACSLFPEPHTHLFFCASHSRQLVLGFNLDLSPSETKKVRKQQMRTWLYPPLPDGHI